MSFRFFGNFGMQWLQAMRGISVPWRVNRHLFAARRINPSQPHFRVSDGLTKPLKGLAMVCEAPFFVLWL